MGRLLAASIDFKTLKDNAVAFFKDFGAIYAVEICLFFLMIFFVSKVLRDNDATKLMVLYWVFIFRRYNAFYLGVFSIADFFYYLSISAVFVFLTVRVLEKKRWS